MDLKKEIIKTSDVVRKKYLALKRGNLIEDEIITKKFKPLVEPLNEIVKDIENSKKKRKHKKDYNLAKQKLENNDNEDDKAASSINSFDGSGNNKAESVVIENSDSEIDYEDGSMNDYLTQIIRDTENKMDHTYGVYLGKKDKWMIGNSQIKFIHNKKILKIKDEEFKPTKGLLELLFKKSPLEIYNDNDLENYKRILVLSSAHLKGYKKGEHIHGTKIPKYSKIIKGLFKQGSGLRNKFMEVNVSPCAPDYVYYDDVNEIIDRLRLLKASESAGNTSHNNEILNIISELRDRGVIY